MSDHSGVSTLWRIRHHSTDSEQRCGPRSLAVVILAKLALDCAGKLSETDNYVSWELADS
jgi:hypothetical protein